MSNFSPKKEYKVLTVGIHEAEKYLNQLADQGWEIISTVSANGPNSVIVYTLQRIVYK